MSLKIYKEGNIVVILDSAAAKRIEIGVEDCVIKKTGYDSAVYAIFDMSRPSELQKSLYSSVRLADLIDENDVAWVEAEFDVFRTEQVGTGTSVAPASDEVWAEAIVEITSAQILAMGTPIELLPAPGAGLYYDYEINFEYTHNTTAYNPGTEDYIFVGNTTSYAGFLVDILSTLGASVNSVFSVDSKSKILALSLSGNDVFSYGAGLNENVVIGTYGGTEVTLGDGTLRAIIRYKVKTFGA